MAGRSANAGEWAEFYVLLNTLADGKLYAADGDLNRLEENFFPVISIEMQEDGQPKNSPKPIHYVIDTKSEMIKVKTVDAESLISMSDFKDDARAFFKIISTRKGRGSFQVPESDSILTKLGNPITKQSSSKKADIHIVIHDIMTGFENEVGFSIKSKHGSAATLINPSGQTLFQYHIASTSDPQIIDVLKSSLLPTKIKDGKEVKIGPKVRIANLVGNDFDLSFKTMKEPEFKENIQLIDSSLDSILAECLKVFMTQSKAGLAEIVEIVAESNPCNFVASSKERVLDFYKYKVKRLIVDAALGMQPKQPWDGKYDVSGGYIVVKETGDVVCYHLYNWNALQDYLYNNLRFETPSSTSTGSKKSFNYGLYYNEGDNHFVDLCLQLRFK